jgi:hypothetical protein
VLTDADPIGGRGGRHATGLAYPTHCAGCAAGEVSSSLLSPSSLDSEGALETIDDGA